jgi:signal transduction histidine kinase
MIETIQSAVARMESVMTRLSGTDAVPQEDRQEVGRHDAGDALADKASQAALAPLLRQLVAENEDRVAALNLCLAAGANSYCLKADGARIETMLSHLLQNAIDAAGAEGRITINLRGQGEWIVLEVSDNGPGMEPQFIETELFRPFRSTKSGGFGIGAYQCRVLAREMGGELEAISARGSGTTMRLSLPRKE